MLTSEPSLGTLRKLSLLARTRWHWRRTRDPETVFRRVSAVASPEQRRSDAKPGDTLPAR
ncbi:hypothetical protein [Halomicrococcus sp. SG-WS-1]|uniref:hypothetical protein n=1 Tax=Halomicrococcus sp. SG-WS-1 TaxID=3439057 RepID=UPI003F792134